MTNLYPGLVSPLSHPFSVSLTTVAMIQSSPTSAEGDGLSSYMVDAVFMPTPVFDATRTNTHTYTHLPGNGKTEWLSPGSMAKTHLAFSQHD